MKSYRRIFVSVAALILCVQPGMTQAAPPLPTVEDLDLLLAQSDYAGALAGSARLISLKGDAAAGIDKAAVYVIKGEAHLHLKAWVPAADAFANAEKAATDPKVAAVDKATEILIRKSRSGIYSPRQPDAAGKHLAPIEITRKDNRPDAYKALFNDEYSAGAQKLKAALTARTIPQLLTAADAAIYLRSLEVAATDKDDKCKADLTAVAAHAKDIMTTAVTTMEKRIDDISRAANQQVVYYDNQRDIRSSTGTTSIRRYKKAGLSDSNMSELKDMYTSCQKIGPACDEFVKVTSDEPAATASWTALTAEATRVGQKAQDVGSADYGNGLKNNQ